MAHEESVFFKLVLISGKLAFIFFIVVIMEISMEAFLFKSVCVGGDCFALVIQFHVPLLEDDLFQEGESDVNSGPGRREKNNRFFYFS